ncbi:TonB-dependent receptor [Asticcacaulis solisilvae]|uniref:TonB-dependent receptor n=1 Tax=Asticcacaulis solisilvae TaxID=1217274 RepID=UPI003FD85547
MSSKIRRAAQYGVLATSTLLVSLLAGAAMAQDATPSADNTDVSDASVKEVIVRAERSKAAANAPSKASLEQSQPQSIVSRPFIDQAVSETADFTSIAALSPSAASAGAANGAGWGEAKLTLRGFQDGQYNISYDGIAFGDTNDPTHHSNSFFPASTVGATIVDRGPGVAGDFGQSNYGGQVQLFSNKITDDQNVTLRESIGSFGAYQSVAVVQTGKVEELGGLKGFVNVQVNGAKGEQTYSPLHANNLTMKFTLPLGETWSLTAFATKNYNYSHNNDNAGATLTQVAANGKDFNLSNDPTKSTYYGYNYIIKDTNFEYLKAEGDLLGFKTESTAYGYFYKNNTFTSTDVTHADLIGDTNAYGAYVTNSVFAKAKTPSNPNDVIGYNKLNEYHVLGDISRASRDFGFGTLHLGLWLEKSSTNRHRYDYDATLGVNTPDNREKPLCSSYTFDAGSGKYTCVATTDPQWNATQYQETSKWWQTQMSADFEWHVTDNLTITPGLKHVDMKRTVAGPVIKGDKSRQPQNASNTFSKTFQFLTANYRLTKNWSVYGQYATGGLLPSLSTLYSADPTKNTVEPQTTTNYQVGTVWQSAHIAADFDVYKIEVNNLITEDPVDTGFYFNSGKAKYDGMEGQVSYAFDFGLTAFVNGSVNNTKDQAGYSLTKAPKNTFGAGALYGHGPLKVALTYKRVGEQYMKTDPTDYLVKAYDSTDAAVNYDFSDRYRLKFQVSNLADHRAVTQIKPFKGAAAFDQYYFQSGRNVQLTLIAKF